MKRHDSVPGMPSQRQLRVGEQVRHALAEILQRGEIHDPVIEAHVITVPEVRMSPDLKLATAYVMPLGGKDEADVVKALNRLARAFRGSLGRRLREMRAMPDLRFRLDERFEVASHIDSLLARPEVARDLKKPAEPEE